VESRVHEPITISREFKRHQLIAFDLNFNNNGIHNTHNAAVVLLEVDITEYTTI